MTSVSLRVLWPPTLRLAPAVNPELAQIVNEVYTNHDLLPPEWTPQQRQDFLQREAARLSRHVAELAADMADQAVKDWINRHGDHPDYLTKTGLVNNATNQATELVLSQELYELIPPPQDDPLEDDTTGLPDRSQVPWDRRWTRTYYRTEPTEEQEDLVAAVWPTPEFPALFRIKAEYLIAARAEDRLPLPADRYDPLADQLAQLVYADLRADGLPTQTTREKP
ncbi:hypothetical protein EB75_01225 [Mycobacterium sp. ST-F2]|nr:hypothetical protein EB75_01225 [Mycobacterium sp. ST-F2]